MTVTPHQHFHHGPWHVVGNLPTVGKKSSPPPLASRLSFAHCSRKTIVQRAWMQKFHFLPPKEEVPEKFNLEDIGRQGKTCCIVTASLLPLLLSPFGFWSNARQLWLFPLPSSLGGEFVVIRYDPQSWRCSL